MTAPVSRRNALRWLYGFVLPQRVRIAKLAAVSILTTGLVVLQPWFTKLIIDQGLIGADFTLLWQLALLSLGLGIAATLLSGFTRLAHTRLSGDVLFAIREDVFGHLLKMSPQFFARQRVGDISSRIDRDVAEVQRFAIDTLFAGFSSVVGLVGAVTMMLLLSWQLSLVLLVLLPLEFIWLKRMRPKVEARNRGFRERSSDLSAFFAEKLPAMKVIQSAGASGAELLRLGGLNRSLMDSLLGLQKLEFVTSAVPTTLVATSRTVVLIVGGYAVVQGSLEVGALIAFTTYVGMAIGPVQSLLGLYLAWQRLTVSLDRISVLREQPVDPREVTGSELSSGITGALALSALAFNYRDDSPLLTEIALYIPAGSKVGIIGLSGAGKSTLLDLITGFLVPASGKISLDHIDQAAIKPSSWRAAFSIAPQDAQLFHDSLRNNICYGTDGVDEAALQSVVSAAGLESLLAKLPEGLDTLVSERGTTLSGGERQRVALARALLKNPSVLILDEPISASDPETGRAVIAAVDSYLPNTTRIIVSHRLDAVIDSDLCFKLQDGRLLAVNPEDLIA